MPKLSDQKFLLNDQYKNTKNLEARNYFRDHFNVNKYGFYRFVFDHFPQIPNLKILELGCGTGSLWTKNINRIPASWEIILSDLSEAMVNKIRKNLNKVRNKIKFQIIDAQSIPFNNETFDMVIANHMLYHVPDRIKALTEIKRVLKPQGYFYASTTGRNHMRELNELLNSFYVGLRLWDKESSEQFILENGTKQLQPFFSNIKLYKYDDYLLVTESEPLIQYVLTTQAKVYLVKRLPDFRKFIKIKLSKGPIRITKDIGLFIAKDLSTSGVD